MGYSTSATFVSIHVDVCGDNNKSKLDKTT